MRGNPLVSLALRCSLVSFVLCSAPLLAHHSNAMYDTTKTITVTGSVTKWQLINPHSALWLEVKNENGAVQLWAGEFTGTLDLYRKFTWNQNTFKPGDRVTIIGNPARNGNPSLMARRVVLANGTEVDLAGT